jgi:hypothetical protein
MLNDRVEFRFFGSKATREEFFSLMAGTPGVTVANQGARYNATGVPPEDWVWVSASATALLPLLVAYFKRKKGKFVWKSDGEIETLKGENCTPQEFAEAVIKIKNGGSIEEIPPAPDVPDKVIEGFFRKPDAPEEPPAK